MSSIDNELLISEVQKYEVLWNTADEAYKDKLKKNGAWIKVASSLINSFMGENEAQQKIILLDVQGRWRTIRDNYVRSLKKQTNNSRSGSAAKKTKLYVYGEQLSFLGKNRELRNTDSNFVDKPLSEPTSPNINERELNSSVNIEDGSYREMAGSSSSSLNEKSTNKRKKPNVEQALVDFMESHNNKVTKNPMEQDEDMAFFYSLLPTVKSLTADQKFCFRMQTMQLLNNIKNKTHINRSINSHSNIQSLLNNTPATSFRPLSHTPDYDFVRPPSATSSAASYCSEFSHDDISNDNFNLQENYNQTNF